MKNEIPIGHALLASGLAGPIVSLPLLLLGIAAESRDRIGMIQMAPIILLLATAFGFAISCLPNLGGTSLLIWLGNRYRIARNPLAWALLGFVMAWLMSAAFSATWNTGNAALGTVGAICALICRSGARWPD